MTQELVEYKNDYVERQNSTTSYSHVKLYWMPPTIQLPCGMTYEEAIEDDWSRGMWELDNGDD